MKEKRIVQWVVAIENTGNKWYGNYKIENEPQSSNTLAPIKSLRDIRDLYLEYYSDEDNPKEHLTPSGEDGAVLITKGGAYIWDEKKANYVRVQMGDIFIEEWYDRSLPEGFRDRKNYFTIVVRR